MIADILYEPEAVSTVLQDRSLFSAILSTVYCFCVRVEIELGMSVACRRHQYVGKAKFIECILAGHNAARVIVGTEQNVIAAISGNNGHIGEITVSTILLFLSR